MARISNLMNDTKHTVNASQSTFIQSDMLIVN